MTQSTQHRPRVHPELWRQVRLAAVDRGISDTAALNEILRRGLLSLTVPILPVSVAQHGPDEPVS